MYLLEWTERKRTPALFSDRQYLVWHIMLTGWYANIDCSTQYSKTCRKTHTLTTEPKCNCIYNLLLYIMYTEIKMYGKSCLCIWLKYSRLRSNNKCIYLLLSYLCLARIFGADVQQPHFELNATSSSYTVNVNNHYVRRNWRIPQIKCKTDFKCHCDEHLKHSMKLKKRRNFNIIILKQNVGRFIL